MLLLRQHVIEYSILWGVKFDRRLFKNWLPGTNDIRTIPIDYDRSVINKVKQPEKIKHIIHKAVEWKQMLDDGFVNSMSEIARKEGLTRARVTQIMNLLKLPAEMQVFLLELNDRKQIRKFSERKLRGYHEQDQFHQSLSDFKQLSGISRNCHERHERISDSLRNCDPDFGVYGRDIR